MKLHLSSHGKSDVGVVRSENDDYILVDENMGIFIVCDGVGGNKSGNIASRTAATQLHKLMEQEMPRIEAFRQNPSQEELSVIGAVLDRFIGMTSEVVYLDAIQDPMKAGMATTMDVLLMLGKHAILGHVGDSRVYLKRNNQIHRLTQDHSVGAEFAKTGKIDPADAKKSPILNVLTRAVGQGRYIQADIIPVEIAQDDLFIMVTDGISDVLADEKILDIASKSNMVEIVDCLVQEGKDRGSRDNLSALVVRSTKALSEEELISTERKVEAVGKASICQYLSYPELVRLINVSEVHRFLQGDVIIREGDAGSDLFIILAGRAAIRKSGVEIGVKESGDFFGEMSLIESGPRTATLVATENTLVLIFRQKALFQFLRSDPLITVKFLWGLCYHLSTVLSHTSKLLVQEKIKSENTVDIIKPFT